MHLSNREMDKLLLHNAGYLAQKRLARGVRLNLPESTALIATQILEFIRDGHLVAELMDIGRQLLGRRQVMAGVPEMLDQVQVEGTFADGSKLVTVHHPIVLESGNIDLALYGSFLPVPAASDFKSETVEPAPCVPGEVIVLPGTITLNEGRPIDCIEVTNTGDRPIQLGSHYHFIETNAALRFPRDRAYGMRLDIPAGTAARFEPGETRSVQLVAIAGNRVIRGGNALASGAVNDANRAAAMEDIQKRHFQHTEE